MIVIIRRVKKIYYFCPVSSEIGKLSLGVLETPADSVLSGYSPQGLPLELVPLVLPPPELGAACGSSHQGLPLAPTRLPPPGLPPPELPLVPGLPLVVQNYRDFHLYWLPPPGLPLVDPATASTWDLPLVPGLPPPGYCRLRELPLPGTTACTGTSASRNCRRRNSAPGNFRRNFRLWASYAWSPREDCCNHYLFLVRLLSQKNIHNNFYN